MAHRSQRLTRWAFLTIAAGTAGAGLLAACGGPATQTPVTAPPRRAGDRAERHQRRWCHPARNREQHGHARLWYHFQ